MEVVSTAPVVSTTNWAYTMPSVPRARRLGGYAGAALQSKRSTVESTSSTLKIVLFAAMPRASDRTTTARKPGFFSRLRKANRTSALRF